MGYEVMQEHEQRVIDEKDELFVKFNKLLSFIGSETWVTLSETEQFLMTKQKLAMQEYINILNERIQLFGV